MIWIRLRRLSPLSTIRLRRIGAWVVALCALTACGDNSRVCGPGTTDVDGVCTGETGDMCGNGTRLDPITNTCVPDPATCGGGTVLINNVCQDPSAALEVDVLEGPEPNGFEANATPAGIIPALKPPGPKGIVIHGCIQPTNNLDPDFDNYLLSVSGPTLVKITADGVEGLAGAFAILSFSTDPRMQDFERFGINLATDVSRREVYLPLAGVYSLVISDARTLQALVAGAAPPPAGNLDGTSCYYVTIDQKVPTIKTLDLAAGDTGMIGEDLAFFQATLPAGFAGVTASLDTPFAASALQVHNNNDLRVIANGDPDATAPFSGIAVGDSPLIVFDHVFNMALEPVEYTITGTMSLQAVPLDGTANGRTFDALGDP